MPIWKCNGKEKVNNNQKKRIYFKILNPFARYNTCIFCGVSGRMLNGE